MHFDPRVLFVPPRPMAKELGIEVGVQLAIDTDEDVLVEPRGDSGGVVISGEERVYVLFTMSVPNNSESPGKSWARTPRRISSASAGEKFPMLEPM